MLIDTIFNQDDGVYQEGIELLDVSPEIPPLSCVFDFFI